MRLIDADALKAQIEEFHCKDCDNYNFVRCRACHIDDAITYLDEAPTAFGWINVKDRLPEKQTPVLVYVPPYSDEDEECIGHVAMSYYTYSARGGFWAGTDGNVYGAIGIIHEPSYWMPLPEPPEEVTVDE